MSKLYKVTLFGKSFIIGWFSYADKQNHSERYSSTVPAYAYFHTLGYCLFLVG